MKIVFCTATWKRPEVFKLFARGIHNIRAVSGCDIDVVVAGSEGNISRELVESHGFKYVESPNDPLATKMNASTLIARDLGADYVMCLGSDDIISPEMFKIYEQESATGVDFIGCTDFYFFDTTSRRALYWAGYADKQRAGITCGAGRMFSRRLMDIWGWQPWKVKHSRLLDNSTQEWLDSNPHTSYIFSCMEHGVMGLDIKSATNMTPFERWDNSCYISSSIIKSEFPYVWDSCGY